MLAALIIILCVAACAALFAALGLYSASVTRRIDAGLIDPSTLA